MKKLKNEFGFTLVELLCCIVIVLLFSAMVSLGMKMSNDAFFKTVRDSEVRTLISTVNAALSDELRYATSVAYAEKKENQIEDFIYSSITQGVGARIKLMKEGEDGLVEVTDAFDSGELYILTEYTIVNKNNGEKEIQPISADPLAMDENPLIPRKAYIKKCQIANFKIIWDNKGDNSTGKKMFTVTYDIIDKNGKKIVENETFQVIPLEYSE